MNASKDHTLKKGVALDFTTLRCVDSNFHKATLSIVLALKKQILSKPNLLYQPYCGRIVTNFDAATERLRNLKVKIDALA